MAYTRASTRFESEWGKSDSVKKIRGKHIKYRKTKSMPNTQPRFPTADVINQVFCTVAMLCWNKTIWSGVQTQTSFNQSECSLYKMCVCHQLQGSNPIEKLFNDSQINDQSYLFESLAWKSKVLSGSGGGSVGRAVASDSRGLQFEYIHQQKYILNIYCQLYWQDENK